MRRHHDSGKNAHLCHAPHVLKVVPHPEAEVLLEALGKLSLFAHPIKVLRPETEHMPDAVC